MKQALKAQKEKKAREEQERLEREKQAEQNSEKKLEDLKKNENYWDNYNDEKPKETNQNKDKIQTDDYDDEHNKQITFFDIKQDDTIIKKKKTNKKQNQKPLDIQQEVVDENQAVKKDEDQNQQDQEWGSNYQNQEEQQQVVVEKPVEKEQEKGKVRSWVPQDTKVNTTFEYKEEEFVELGKEIDPEVKKRLEEEKLINQEKKQITENKGAPVFMNSKKKAPQENFKQIELSEQEKKFNSEQTAIQPTSEPSDLQFSGRMMAFTNSQKEGIKTKEITKTPMQIKEEEMEIRRSDKVFVSETKQSPPQDGEIKGEMPRFMSKNTEKQFKPLEKTKQQLAEERMLEQQNAPRENPPQKGEDIPQSLRFSSKRTIDNNQPLMRPAEKQNLASSKENPEKKENEEEYKPRFKTSKKVDNSFLTEKKQDKKDEFNFVDGGYKDNEQKQNEKQTIERRQKKEQNNKPETVERNTKKDEKKQESTVQKEEEKQVASKNFASMKGWDD